MFIQWFSSHFWGYNNASEQIITGIGSYYTVRPGSATLLSSTIASSLEASGAIEAVIVMTGTVLGRNASSGIADGLSR